MNNMLWFDHDLYVTENMILVITGNISLIIIINTVDIMKWFNKTNSFLIYLIIIKDYDLNGTPKGLYKHKIPLMQGTEKTSKKPLSFFIIERTHTKEVTLR